MLYAYQILNKTNDRIFYGLTQDFEYIKKMHLKYLNENKHWLKLLQKDFNKKHDFEIKELINDNNEKKVFNYIFDRIKKDETYFAGNGYNLPFTYKKKDVNLISDEDLIFCYFENDKKPSKVTYKYNISYNALTYRLKRNSLLSEKMKISTYPELYAYSELLLALEDDYLRTSQVLDKIMDYYDISSRLGVSAIKISRNLAHKPYIKKIKKSGFAKYTID